MNFVFFERFGVDGLECAEAYIERDFAEFATFGFEFVENFRGEVESRRGRGNRARLLATDVRLEAGLWEASRRTRGLRGRPRPGAS